LNLELGTLNSREEEEIMFLSRFRFVLIVTLLAGGLVACDQGAGSPKQPQSESSLKQAMAVAPATTEMLAFTDWTLLKKYMGLEKLPAKRTEAELREFNNKSESQVPAAFLQSGMLLSGSEGSLLDVWSWDFTYLLWEAEMDLAKGRFTHVLKFRDNFDFAPVVAHFKERGFQETEYAGAKVYSHGLDMKADWEQSGRFLSFYNMALLTEDKIMVLSNSVEAVHPVLDAAKKGGTNLLADKSTVDLVDTLGELGSATIFPGVFGCKFLTITIPPGANPTVKAALEPVLSKVAKAHKYDAVAQGYRYEAGKSLAFVALHYGSIEVAKSDVEIRRSLLAEGQSMFTEPGVSYADILKTRKGEYQVDVEGSTLMVKVKGDNIKREDSEVESNLIPRTLNQMLIARDMTFAACP
jgi:hypothetical protein